MKLCVYISHAGEAHVVLATWVASWCRGRASDSRSRGRGFESQPGTTA